MTPVPLPKRVRLFVRDTCPCGAEFTCASRYSDDCSFRHAQWLDMHRLCRQGGRTTVTPDLTCRTCGGTGTCPPGDADGLGCWDCADGRRLPTLAEWDALVAENERLRREVKRDMAWHAERGNED